MTNSMNDTNTPNNNSSEAFVLPTLDELAKMTNEEHKDKPHLRSEMIHMLTDEQKKEIQRQIEDFEKKYDVVLPEDFKKVQLQYYCGFIIGRMFICSSLKTLDEEMNYDWVDPEVAERPKNLICLGGGDPYYYMLDTDTGRITILGHDLVTNEGLTVDYFPIADNFELLLRGSLYAELKRMKYLNGIVEQTDREALKKEMTQIADAVSYAVGGPDNYYQYWREAVGVDEVDDVEVE